MLVSIFNLLIRYSSMLLLLVIISSTFLSITKQAVSRERIKKPSYKTSQKDTNNNLKLKLFENSWKTPIRNIADNNSELCKESNPPAYCTEAMGLDKCHYCEKNSYSGERDEVTNLDAIAIAFPSKNPLEKKAKSSESIR